LHLFLKIKTKTFIYKIYFVYKIYKTIAMKTPIKVKKTEKSTTLRISESTKRELETFGTANETHEKIIKKLINIAKNSVLNPGQGIIKKGNAIGTEYNRIVQSFDIETEKDLYVVVCTFNDLRQKILVTKNLYLRQKFPDEWELNLEIVSLSRSAKKNDYGRIVSVWNTPRELLKKDKNEYLLLYFIAVKQVLEETFNLNLFEFSKQEDYFNLEKWRNIYIMANLSMESYYDDIETKLKNDK
jgi:hypothetical protein